MATAFVSLPLVIRELVPVLTEIGTEQEQAARSLGASGLQTFVRITLPAIRWALLYGVVLSLARSLGEFGAVKIVSGGVAMRTQTATFSSRSDISSSACELDHRVHGSLHPGPDRRHRSGHRHQPSTQQGSADEYQDRWRRQDIRRLRGAAGHRPRYRDRRTHRSARA